MQLQCNSTIFTDIGQKCCALSRMFFINSLMLIFAERYPMIQRIQSVYLLLVAVIGVLLYCFPLVSLVPSQAGALPVIYHISALQVESLVNGTSDLYVRYWPTLVLNALIIAFSFYTILQYKKRPLQIKCANGLMLMILVLLVLFALDVDRLRSGAASTHMIAYNLYSALPVIQVVLVRMAVGGIKKDEALVRSADRLR